jgi:hypothetical protein
MSAERYVYVVDLETGKSERCLRPATVANLDDAEIVAPGKCATIHVLGGLAYVGAHSRCAAALWNIAGGGTVEDRPQTPWVAYRNMSAANAGSIAWAWLEKRGIVDEG